MIIETFVPFDREAAFASAVVLAVAATVDPSLVKNCQGRHNTACKILDEMVNCGNLIAELQRHELDELDTNLRQLQELAAAAVVSTAQSHVVQSTPESTASYNMTSTDGLTVGNTQVLPDFDFGNLLCEWNSEDGLNSQQLNEVADALDFGQLNWPVMGDLDGWG